MASDGAELAERLERAGHVLARIALYAGAIILFAMLALTCIDVFGRYILSAPVNGKTELTRFMMAGLIACALPVVSVMAEHIAVDLLDTWFTRRAAALRDLIVDLLMCGCLLVLGDWLIFRADRLMKRGYVSDFLHVPLHPVAYFIAAMTLVTALALLLKVILHSLYLKNPELRSEPEPGSLPGGGL